MLFGTDGVRGVAGELLTAELAMRLGAAATREVGGQELAGDAADTVRAEQAAGHAGLRA